MPASRWVAALVLFLGSLLPPVALAQTLPAPPSPTPLLRGRTVEEVQILGNAQVPSSVIRNVIRTKAGDKYDPAGVQDDYQRIYNLKKFSTVDAQVEPTKTGGVKVVFIVAEQKLIKSITYQGNKDVETSTLQGAHDLKVGQAIDSFRISVAQQEILNLYRDKNYPFAEVVVPPDPLTRSGQVIFKITEGPQVRVRYIDFKGVRSFDKDRLQKQIKTETWFPIFRSGKYDAEQVEEDMGALRRFYGDHGFFDVRVGRKLIFSPDLSEMQIDFLIDEGPRYVVNSVSFEFEGGQATLPEKQLRRDLRLLPGRYYDAETEQRDVRQLVKEYSPRGYIYGGATPTDPNYLKIEVKKLYERQPGKVQLVYSIREGRPFHVGRFIVKGNNKSQDKLALREFREFASGSLFNSAAVQEATERLRATPYFQSVSVTPIGDNPDIRDVLIEVTEQKTASFTVGAGVNSNGGVGGNITFEQRNFDLGNVPNDIRDIFSEHAFTGGGQRFRATFEPGTIQTNAILSFYEPYLFDLPYSFNEEGYLHDRLREHYDDRRVGDAVSLGKRFDYEDTGILTLRGELVKVQSIEDARYRAPEILEARGKSVLTSVGFQFRRDTTNPGLLPYHGYVATAGVEMFGALGGDYTFQRFSAGFDDYFTVYQDLLDRKTTLAVHLNTGFIIGNPFVDERFYGGGIGSIRGFRFRGVSPRSGRGNDPIGGDFTAAGTVELNYPIYGETLRGVVFTDFGDVENDVKFGVMRASVGTGIRLILPFLGQTPLAIDFAVPVTRERHDDTQFISFSFGLSR